MRPGMIDPDGIEESTFFDSQTTFEIILILLSSSWTDDHGNTDEIVHSLCY